MPTYAIHVLEPTGVEREVWVWGHSLPDALLRMKERNMKPLELRWEMRSAPLPRGVSEQEVYLFFQALASAVEHGVSLPEAFRTVGASSRNIVLQNIAYQIAHELSCGKSIAEALSQHPGLFWRPIVMALATAERTGALDKSLSEIAEALPFVWHSLAPLVRALIYPGVLAFFVSILLSVAGGLLTSNFFKLLMAMDIGAPSWITPRLATTIVSSAALMMLLLALLIVTFAILLRIYRRSGFVRTMLGESIIQMPFIGSAFYWHTMSRVAAALSMFLSERTPTPDALYYTAEMIEVPLVQTALWAAHERIVNYGEPLHVAMSATGAFPETLTWRLANATDTNELSSGLHALSRMYREVFTNHARALAGIIEPALILVIAITGTSLLFGFIMVIVRTMITTLSGGG